MVINHLITRHGHGLILQVFFLFRFSRPYDFFRGLVEDCTQSTNMALAHPHPRYVLENIPLLC